MNISQFTVTADVNISQFTVTADVNISYFTVTADVNISQFTVTADLYGTICDLFSECITRHEALPFERFYLDRPKRESSPVY